MKLITQGKKTHVSQDAVEEFESAVLRDPRVRPVTRWPFAGDVGHAAIRVLRRAPVSLAPPAPLARHFDAVFKGSGRDCFLVMMGPHGLRFVPHFLVPGRKSIYLFDAWPNAYGLVRALVARWHVQNLFVSSSQAALALGSSIPDCRVSWIPEGIDSDHYEYRSCEAKDIDVLQLGRKHDAYHERIRAPLEAGRKTYLYEKAKGKIVFPTRAAFVDGLARAKVSVCFPCNMTHPERSGDTETMSQRYLQSMAAKCVIVGHAPAEMKALFGYDPVVEAHMDDPAGQLNNVLANFSDYMPLVERNYRSVTEDHTWRVRWQTIAGVLFPQPNASTVSTEGRWSA